MQKSSQEVVDYLYTAGTSNKEIPGFVPDPNPITVADLFGELIEILGLIVEHEDCDHLLMILNSYKYGGLECVQ